MRGGEWAYFKWYCGETTAEHVLVCVNDLTEPLLQDRLVTQWFFIRYNDGWPHIRIRFKLSDAAAWPAVTDRVQAFVSPWLAEERIWKTAMDTYEPERERYGDATMELSEELFRHDSELIQAALAIVRDGGDENLRWQLALAALARLLQDVGLDTEASWRLLDRWTAGLLGERKDPKATAKGLDRLFRERRGEIDRALVGGAALFGGAGPSGPARWAEALEARSRAAQALVSAHGGHVPDTHVLSFVHMSCNRLFIGQPREHELAVCWLLAKHFRGIRHTLVSRRS
jgi:thiopeptide-type bacteriocin biosynthesis protein